MEKSSIIIPHYRTPDHLDFCLRCITYFTTSPHETIVVDNGSDKATCSRLRKRNDIILLQRQQDPSLNQEGHKAALDYGISRATGKYIIAIHSDTFVMRKGWIAFLTERLESSGYLAYGPCTHRLYPFSTGEKLKEMFQRKSDPNRIRPVFTIYRPEIFQERGFMDFSDVGDLTKSFVQSGKAGFLSRKEACLWAFHAGGTVKLTLLHHRRKARRKKQRIFRAFWAQKEIQEITKGKSMFPL